MPSIKYKKKTYAGATFPVLEMTKAEYDALPEAKKMDGTVYMITDDTGGWEAEDSAYDNTESGLTATNVQDALDELNSNQVKTKIVTVNFPAETWVTIPKPTSARKILSVRMVSQSISNGYWLLWNERSADILALRLNTASLNVEIVNAASTNAQIEIAYI